MKCPKCKELLAPAQLFDSLDSAHCPTCQGQWVDGDNYQEWQQSQARVAVDPYTCLQTDLATYQVPAPLDAKAGLCPQCQTILSRTKVSTQPFFYLDHCLACNGIWFDPDEANILVALRLHDRVDVLYSHAWQQQVRTAQLALSEKEAIVAKLGNEIAQQVFDLADVLKDQPNGDFAVAYLMRRFERDPVSRPQ